MCIYLETDRFAARHVSNAAYHGDGPFPGGHEPKEPLQAIGLLADTTGKGPFYCDPLSARFPNNGDRIGVIVTGEFVPGISVWRD
jgi:hypothetical protein